VEDDRLLTDDDITSSDTETEQNIVSESDSGDDWTFIIGVSHDFKRFLMNLFVVCLNIPLYSILLFWTIVENVLLLIAKFV